MVHEIVNILFFDKYFSFTNHLRITSSLFLLVMSCKLFVHILGGDYYPQLSAGGIIGYIWFGYSIRYLGVYCALIFIVIFLSLSFALSFSFNFSLLKTLISKLI